MAIMRGRILSLAWVLVFAGISGYGPSASGANTNHLFMSLKSDKVNMRVGPGRTYPVIWTYTAAEMPMQVIARHHQWLQVRDMDGETGWMHSRLLSRRRSAIIAQDNASLFHHPDPSSSLVATLMRGVIVRPEQCRARWCAVTVHHEAEALSGWIAKSALWGITDDEVFEK